MEKPPNLCGPAYFERPYLSSGELVTDDPALCHLSDFKSKAWKVEAVSKQLHYISEQSMGIFIF